MSHFARLSHCVLLLILATALVFSRVPTLPFISYDDGAHVFANPKLSPVTLETIWSFWNVPFRAPTQIQPGEAMAPYEQLYAPVTFTVFALLSFIGRFQNPVATPTAGITTTINPATYHAANLILHMATALLLFALLRRLLSRSLRDDSNDSDARLNFAALTGALLWSVHPLQVETVAWISPLNTVLSGFWAVCCLIVFLKACEIHAAHAGRRFWKLYLGATLCFLLCLLSKPSMAILPLIALLLGVWRYNMPWMRGSLLIAPWLLVSGVLALIVQKLQPPLETGATSALWQRPFVVGDALSFYLGKALWPLELSADYGRNPQWIMSHWWGFATWMGIGAALWLAWKIRHRHSWAGVGLLIFCITLLPGSGLVPYYFHLYSTVADRYVYFALFGLSMVVAASLLCLFNSSQTRKTQQTVGVLAVLWIGLLGYWTNNLTHLWSDAALLWANAARVNERSWLAYNNLANSLNASGQKEEAIVQYKNALFYNPRMAVAHYNLGILLDQNGDSREGLSHLEKAVMFSPNDAEPRNSLAVALMKRGRFEEAQKQWKKSLSLAPNYIDARVNYGVALAMRGQTDRAIAQWTQALKDGAKSPDLYFNLGIALEGKKRYAQALEKWRLALQIDPGFAKAQFAIQRVQEAVAATNTKTPLPDFLRSHQSNFHETQ